MKDIKEIREALRKVIRSEILENNENYNHEKVKKLIYISKTLDLIDKGKMKVSDLIYANLEKNDKFVQVNCPYCNSFVENVPETGMPSMRIWQCEDCEKDYLFHHTGGGVFVSKLDWVVEENRLNNLHNLPSEHQEAVKKAIVKMEKEHTVKSKKNVLDNIKDKCLHVTRFYDSEIQAFYCPECESYLQDNREGNERVNMILK